MADEIDRRCPPGSPEWACGGEETAARSAARMFTEEGTSQTMPSLNLDLDYLEHPRLLLLIEEFGEWAEFCPVRLLIFTGKFHAETGEITGHATNLIEKWMKWRGKKGEGIQAMVKYGWLEPIEGGYRVHNFLKRQGHLAAYKIRGKAAADARWKKARGDPDACGMQQAYGKHTGSNAPTGHTDGADKTDGTDKGGTPRVPPLKGLGFAPDYAQRFCFMQTGRKESVYDVASEIESMVAFGYREEDIAAEIDKPNTEREHGERFYKLKQRLEKAKAGKHGPPPKNDGRTTQLFRGTVTPLESSS